MLCATRTQWARCFVLITLCCLKLWNQIEIESENTHKKIEGDDYYYVTRMNLYISHFSDGVLILRYINKMGTRGGGVVATIASHTLLARVEIPTGCKSFFSLIFVYKLTSTNSYIL